VEKEDISTHVSGGVVFAAKLVSVATGIIFTLTVAAALSTSDYGAYGIFGNLIVPLFTVLSAPIPFWTMRFIARNKKGSAKTGVFGNLIISGVVTLVFLATLPLVISLERLQGFVPVFAIVAAEIIEIYMISVFEAYMQAKKPHFTGVGLLVGEFLKVALVLLLLVKLELGVLGAISAIVVAYAVKSGFYLYVLRGEFREKIQMSYIKQWFKGSTFNLYNIAGNELALVSFIWLGSYAGTIGYGYYFAALQIANIILYSTFIAYALTPRLLAHSNIDEATTSLKYVLMFAVPMTAGVLATPTSFLLFLKEGGDYAVAAPILRILAIDSLIAAVSTVFTYILYGFEKVDEKAEIPFRQVTKSKLFIAFSLPYVHSAITLPVAYVALTSLAVGNPVLMVIYVTAITAIARFATFLILYNTMRKDIKVRIPWLSIMKYVVASVVMAVVLYVASPAQRSETLIFTVAGGLIYIIVLFAIDKGTRKLAQTMLRAVRERVNL
jgi:O-antigen/teichoic acid export membrane protein